MTLPSGVVTFLFTDVVGSSAMRTRRTERANDRLTGLRLHHTSPPTIPGSEGVVDLQGREALCALDARSSRDVCFPLERVRTRG